MTPPEAGEVVEIHVDRLVAGGDGIGRLDGLAVFVRGTAPGDRATVEITEVRRRFARARLLEVLEPGPGRRVPPCPLAAECGGCAWMHLTESAQSEARLALVRDALVRIARLDEVPELTSLDSPRLLGYRSRARVAFEDGRVGFRTAGSRSVIDVDRCAVLDEPTQRELSELRARRPRGRGEVELRGFGERVRVAGHDYRVSPGAFFQPNGALWDAWLAAVTEACGRGERAVELYAGVGFYTRVLAERFARVVAVERSRAARDLRENVRMAADAAPGAEGGRASHVEVVHASCEPWAVSKLSGLAPDLVLLNPPRAGAHADVCDAIRRARPRRVVYVSCDPATLARDLVRLSPTLRVKNVCVMNALPQTPHVEVLVTLERVDTRANRSLESDRAGSKC